MTLLLSAAVSVNLHFRAKISYFNCTLTCFQAELFQTLFVLHGKIPGLTEKPFKMCRFRIFNHLIHTFCALHSCAECTEILSCMLLLDGKLDDAKTKAQDAMQSTLTSTWRHSIRVTAYHAEICREMKLCVDFIGEVLPLVHGLACICGLQMQCYIKAVLQIVSCTVFCVCVIAAYPLHIVALSCVFFSFFYHSTTCRRGNIIHLGEEG